jgi:hypothetical protein
MKLRKPGFQGGKYAPIANMMKYSEVGNITESKDISVNPAERLLLTLHVLQNIIARKMLNNGYSMPSV